MRFMEILKPYRARIDALDDQIIDLLVERTGVIAEVAELKAHEGIAPVLQDRVDEVRERAISRAVQKGMDGDIIRDIYTRLIAFSCQLEEDFANSTKQKDTR